MSEKTCCLQDKILINSKILYLENYPVKSPKECINSIINNLISEEYDEVIDTIRIMDIELNEYIESILKQFNKHLGLNENLVIEGN